MVKALAQAFWWLNLLESGVIGALEGIAAAEKINAPYVSRASRQLVLPDIINLDGRQPIA